MKQYYNNMIDARLYEPHSAFFTANKVSIFADTQNFVEDMTL